jgi:hypothetical protein
MTQFLNDHQYIIGLACLVAMWYVFRITPKDRENLRRGNTKYLRRNANMIKESLDSCINEYHLETVRIMMQNFENAYGGTLQGRDDLAAMEIMYRATKWKIEQDSRYIDEMNQVMLYGQNLRVDEYGHLIEHAA